METECKFTKPVEINFVEINIEDNKKQILNKEIIKLLVRACNNMIDEYTREMCYNIYQNNIIEKSHLNSF